MRERGNILFLILLAVILFAALSYAVTSSMRGGGNNATKESLSTEITKIENFGMLVRTALQRMNMTGGYPLWQIAYNKTDFSTASGNASCTANDCKLHNSSGGAIAGYVIPENMRDDPVTCSNVTTWYGRYYFRNISIKGIGTDNNRDLVLLYPAINKALCMAINEKYGVMNSATAPPTDTATGYDYTGTLTEEVDLNSAPTLGDQEPSISGKTMFCTGNNGGCNYLYYVLHER